MMNRNIELEEIIDGIRPIKKEWVETAQARTAQLVMPLRALGKLHNIAEQLCGIKQTINPSLSRKVILIMAGDHGVVAEGVNPYPQEITGEMIRAFLAGGAGINVFARHVGAEVWVVDMGIIPELDPATMDGGERLLIRKVARGTGNLAKGPAMSRQDAERAILTGFNLASDQIDRGADILGTGDMGIGNTTPSAAIGTVIMGKTAIEMVGRGTGVDDEGLKRKQDAVNQGIQANQPDPRDGLDVLAKVGGFEIGGIAGSILAGAYHRCPVVMDGFISTAGALIAHTLCPTVKDYLFAGHCSEEQGHRTMLEYLGCEPILNLGMRLGEGSGGALAIGIMEAAVQAFSGISTFEEAGVTEKGSS